MSVKRQRRDHYNRTTEAARLLFKDKVAGDSGDKSILPDEWCKPIIGINGKPLPESFFRDSRSMVLGLEDFLNNKSYTNYTNVGFGVAS